MKKILIIVLFFSTWSLYAQTSNTDSSKIEKQFLDSAFIYEIEATDKLRKPKVLHAEPLYIDLIRDLGARKGEKEWNFGFGMQDKRNFDEFHALVEYEFAPIDRLGFEIELPFSMYSFRSMESGTDQPENRLESIKLATQWTFLVNEKHNTSLALGYIHEFTMVGFERYRSEQTFNGNVYNPFLVAAKRWGTNYHTLLYTGPVFEKMRSGQLNTGFEINSNFHYMISGTRNFIGLEVNQYLENGNLETTLRPQMRVGLAENLMIGIVSAIPLGQPNNGLGSFVRIIYEPGFRSMH
ncbi:MAG: HAEPLYID family protein [Bacteroidota bacterium]